VQSLVDRSSASTRYDALAVSSSKRTQKWISIYGL
jgi:hypothetical protein